MTCTQLTNGVVICQPGGALGRRIMYCPVCERRHRFVIRLEAWYGATQYGWCGDTWSDGERLDRPFKRGWRQEAQQHTRQLWSKAMTWRQALAAFSADTVPHLDPDRSTAQ